MDVFGGYLVPASADTVWAAFGDRQRIEAALPQALVLTDMGFDRFAVAPNPATNGCGAPYTGTLSLLERDPPKSCRIKGEGADDEARSATVEGKIELLPEGDDTRVVYALRLAAWAGDRAVDPTALEAAARGLLTAFFDRFWLPFGEVQALDPATGTIADHPRDGLPPLLWASGLLVLIAALLWLAHLIGRA